MADEREPLSDWRPTPEFEAAMRELAKAWIDALMSPDAPGSSLLRWLDVKKKARADGR
jgi:hypothetical protein